MKKLLLFILLNVFSISIFAQNKADLKLENAVKALTKAMIEADKSTLNTLISDDLSYGHSSGNVENKAHFIETLMTGESDFVTIDLSEQSIKITGKTAVVRHKLIAETNNRGVKGSANLKVLLIWIKEGKSWKLLARQAVKIQ